MPECAVARGHNRHVAHDDSGVASSFVNFDLHISKILLANGHSSTIPTLLCYPMSALNSGAWLPFNGDSR
jgi:hypothetical protein